MNTYFLDRTKLVVLWFVHTIQVLLFLSGGGAWVRTLPANSRSSFISLIMKLRFGSLTLGAVLLSAPVVFAQTLVSWGPSTTYVTSTTSGQRAAIAGVISFNLDTPVSPLTSAGYTGGAYYGGASSIGTTASMNAGFQVSNNYFLAGSIDAQTFGRDTGVTAGHVVTGVFLWKQADFITGSNVADDVTVTSLSFRGLVTNAAAINNEARFVLQQGSTYLISANIGLSSTLATHSLTTLSSVDWFAYNPATSIGSIGSVVSSPVFSDVTAVGLFLRTQANDTAGIRLAFNTFSSEGFVSAIPEPSSAALLVGSGVIALAALRRRKR